MDNNIQLIDLSIISTYLVGIFFLAKFSSRNSKNQNLVNEQYLAGKSLTFFESLLSIIATEVSALTFLGIPAFAFSKDFSFLHIYFGAVIGRIIIAKLMLPLVYDKGLTIYSVMGNNGSKNGQRTIAIFYAINKFLAVGVRLFSGSILVAAFFNISIYIAVSIITLITFFYTLIGGLKAVVRTDMVQMLLFTSGGLAAHFLIPDLSGSSWTSMMSIALEGGKLNLYSANGLSSMLFGIFGGIIFDMSTHGVDQDFMQRLTANRSLKSAQRAIITSSFLSITIATIFLGIGALLWAHYHHTLPSNVKADQVFAYFISQNFPPGLKGLMVAGVLAATMSTLDSSINALSACFYNDIFNLNKEKSSHLKSRFKTDTLIITITLLLIAFIASKSDGVLELGLKITSWTAGSLLAIFFNTLILRSFKLEVSYIVITYCLGIGIVTLNTFILELHWSLNAALAFFIGIIYGYIIKIIR